MKSPSAAPWKVFNPSTPFPQGSRVSPHVFNVPQNSRPVAFKTVTAGNLGLMGTPKSGGNGLCLVLVVERVCLALGIRASITVNPWEGRGLRDKYIGCAVVFSSALLTKCYGAGFEELAKMKVIQLGADERGAVAGLDEARRVGFLAYGRKLTTVALPEAIGYVRMGYLLRTEKRTYVIANRQVFSRPDSGSWTRASLRLTSNSPNFLFAFSLQNGIVVYESVREGEQQLTTTTVLGDNGDQQTFRGQGQPKRMGPDRVIISQGKTAITVCASKSVARKSLKIPGDVYLASSSGDLVCGTGYLQAGVIDRTGETLVNLGEIRREASRMVFGKEQKRLWYTDADLGLALWDRRKLHRGWAAGSVDCIRVAGSSVVAFMRRKKGAHLTVFLCTFENGRPRADKLADCPGPTSSHTIATGGGGIYVGTGSGLFLLNLATPSALVAAAYSEHRDRSESSNLCGALPLKALLGNE